MWNELDNLPRIRVCVCACVRQSTISYLMCRKRSVVVTLRHGYPVVVWSIVLMELLPEQVFIA